MNKYNDLFSSDDCIEQEFDLKSGYLKDNNLETLYATYNYQDYSGEAFLVFRNTDTDCIYEVNAGHCSCHGLEGQFQLEAIKIRKDNWHNWDFVKIAEFIEQVGK